MTTAIEDDALLARIAGLMDETFTVEGAIYYLLGKHLIVMDEEGATPASAAWMLLEGHTEPVLEELEALSRAAKEGETAG